MTSVQLQLLFVDVALILLLARGLGAVAARFGQPPVVGEILAGIALGPTLFHGALARTLFPTDIRPPLTALADVGLALFMFAVGLEMEGGVLRGRGRVAAGAAMGSTLVPFALGLGLGGYLLLDHHAAHRGAFVVFVGLSVSVTAFPVLARILADRKLAATDLGSVALAAAAAVDVAAWLALAAIQAVVGGGLQNWKIALTLPYLAVLLLVVRPLLRRMLAGEDGEGPFAAHTFAVVLTGALASAAATEAAGLHFIFGAFLFGAVMPRRGTAALRERYRERTGQAAALLLPVYFVTAGLSVNLGGLSGRDLADLAVIMAVAVVGKFAGTYLGARTQRLPPRPAAALGVLMNTRGLTELVILGIGLQLGLLDGRLYSLMVVMAVVTTVMTGPLLARVYTRPVEVPRGARAPEPRPVAARSH